MKKLSFVFTLILLSYTLFSQTNKFYDSSFKKVLHIWNTSGGGNTYLSNSAQCIEASDSGNFIVVGACGGGDPYLMQVSSDGEVDWLKVLDLTCSDGPTEGYAYAQFNELIRIDSGYFVAVGSVLNECSEGMDIILIRFDKNGNILNRKIYGIGDQTEYGYGVAETHDNCILVSGSRVTIDQNGMTSEILTLKLAYNFDYIQFKIIEDVEIPICYAYQIREIKTARNCYYYISGTLKEENGGKSKAFLCNTDTAMSSINYFYIYEAGDERTSLSTAKQKIFGQTLVQSGNLITYDNAYIPFLYLNGDGSVQNSKSLGGSGYDECHGLYVDSDSNLHIAGMTTTASGDGNFQSLYSIADSGLNSIESSIYGFECSSTSPTALCLESISEDIAYFDEETQMVCGSFVSGSLLIRPYSNSNPDISEVDMEYLDCNKLNTYMLNVFASYTSESKSLSTDPYPYSQMTYTATNRSIEYEMVNICLSPDYEPIPLSPPSNNCNCNDLMKNQ
jgi:hypothetical protein